MKQHPGSSYDVVIAGGGLAGCSAAIALAQAGRSVLVLEKDRMPRTKLCGEFLSMEVADLCARLGLQERLIAAGARIIRRLLVTAPGGAVFETHLPGPAMGLSRYTLDAAFVDRAREAGAEIREGCAVQSISGSMGHGFSITFDGGEVRSRAVLGAYGRRSILDKRLGRTFLQDISPYVAFKAHFVGLDLADCIELHSFPGGYCGLLTEDHGAVNACWITNQNQLKEAQGSPRLMIDKSFRENKHLGERFDSLERTSEFHSASQLFFHRKTLFEADVCMIGDSAGMIAPLCGDGMAMAIQSGTLAGAMLEPYLDGHIGASVFQESYEREWRSKFAMRMRLGQLLHAAFVRPGVLGAGLSAARFFPSAAGALIRATRG